MSNYHRKEITKPRTKLICTDEIDSFRHSEKTTITVSNINPYLDFTFFLHVISAPEPCEDKHPDCKQYKDIGLCSPKYPVVLKTCKKSCGRCP